MRGRPPKDNPQDGGTRRGFEFTELGRDPIVDPPKIGRRPGGGRWTKDARDYWEMWTRAPMASQFEETDWNHLRRTAVLLEAFLANPTPAAFKAIEHAESLLGATVSSRLQLRLRPHRRAAAAEAEKTEPAANETPRLRRVAGDPRLALVDKKGDT
jgi:hypothetical protein